MYQTSGGFTIASISNGKFIALNTKDATGATNVNGLVCRDGNQSYLQSNTNTVNRIDITGNQVTIGGVNVPVITTQPLNTSNNNEIASTAFVKNQSYAVTTSSNAFTANNTFITQAIPFFFEYSQVSLHNFKIAPHRDDSAISYDTNIIKCESIVSMV